MEYVLRLFDLSKTVRGYVKELLSKFRKNLNFKIFLVLGLYDKIKSLKYVLRLFDLSMTVKGYVKELSKF